MTGIVIQLQTEAHWSDAFTPGQLMTFADAVDQGEYLYVSRGERAVVVSVNRTAPQSVVMRMELEHHQLGERNLLRFDGNCEDILDSLLGVNHNSQETITSCVSYLTDEVLTSSA